MTPQVSGLFYTTKLQNNIDWWKSPQHFVSKKVLRWVEYGVKVDFKKGLAFLPKPSAPKFLDLEDVDFVIKDLLKDRLIGAYQDLFAMLWMNRDMKERTFHIQTEPWGLTTDLNMRRSS
jgi:hypothetical protein